MDGVVSDTQRIHSVVEAELLLGYGIRMSPAEITRRFSGVSGRDMWPAIFAEAGVACPPPGDLSDAAWNRTLRRPTSEIVEVPGATELIRILRRRNIPLAIASGSRLVFIERVLTALDLMRYFHAIASSQEVPHGKPAPDVFLLAAQRLGVDPASCVVVEDGINGMCAARAAGMRCIALVSDTTRSYPATLIISELRHFPFEWFGG